MSCVIGKKSLESLEKVLSCNIENGHVLYHWKKDGILS